MSQYEGGTVGSREADFASFLAGEKGYLGLVWSDLGTKHNVPLSSGEASTQSGALWLGNNCKVRMINTSEQFQCLRLGPGVPTCGEDPEPGEEERGGLHCSLHCSCQDIFCQDLPFQLAPEKIHSHFSPSSGFIFVLTSRTSCHLIPTLPKLPWLSWRKFQEFHFETESVYDSGEKNYESVAAWFIKTFDVSVQRAMIIMNTFNEIAVGVEQLCSWKPLRALYRLSLFCGQGFENCSLFCILYLYIYIMALKCLDELLLPCCQHCWGKKECYRLLSVGFHKKSGLLTRGNTIRQKGKIFSTWLRTKFPGKWFPHQGAWVLPVNRHVAYCRPHSMNTLEIAPVEQKRPK